MRVHSSREKRGFRQWIYITKNTTIHHSWRLFPGGFGFQIGLADYECAISLYIQAIIFSFYFSINNCSWEQRIQEKTKRCDEKYGYGRTIGFSIHDKKVWVDLWNDPMQWSFTDPWWHHFTIDPIEAILGKEKIYFDTINKGESQIVMPEGVYPCKYEIRKYFHKRSRWKERSRLMIKVDIPSGIPVEGKGENSYDCGMDAYYG